MLLEIKYFIKKMLAFIGLYHPSLGIKVHQKDKATIILGYKTPALRTFIETGTCQGNMIESMVSHFQKVYSIELDEKLYKEARERFKGRKNVELLLGDSGVEINKILERLKEPALFWLDAHMSGAITAANSPVVKELEAVLNHGVRGHVVLIDDARHFDRTTISWLRKLAKASGYRFIIKDGIFRLYGR